MLDTDKGPFMRSEPKLPVVVAENQSFFCQDAQGAQLASYRLSGISDHLSDER